MNSWARLPLIGYGTSVLLTHSVPKFLFHKGMKNNEMYKLIYVYGLVKCLACGPRWVFISSRNCGYFYFRRISVTKMLKLHTTLTSFTDNKFTHQKFVVIIIVLYMDAMVQRC